MPSLEDKLQYHNSAKFDEDNDGFVEIMKAQLLMQIQTAIDDGKKLFDNLAQEYKEFYKNGQVMLSETFQKDFGRHAHSLKGQAHMTYVTKMFEPMAKLQKSIDGNIKDDIDKYIYEVFAFKKKYFECLYAIQNVDFEEQEFDLRQFDEFTGLNLAQIYQSIPINSKSLTFNQIGTQSILNNMDQNVHNHNKGQGQSNQIKTLVSENVNEKVELIKVQSQKAVAPPPKEGEEQGKLLVIGEIKIHDSPDSLYSYCKMPKERGQQLYMLRRPQLSSEDLPIEQTLTCTIF